MAASVRSSPLAALGVLLACLAIASLGRERRDVAVTGAPISRGQPRAAGPLDLNTASAAELETLPRIGPALAERIVRYREEHGPFLRVEDLDAVSGIGPATVNGLRDRVTISTRLGDEAALLAPEAPR